MNDPCFPAKGNRARLKWLPDDPGVILNAGPDQSEIRFDSDKRTRVYSNGQFERAPPAPIKPSSRNSAVQSEP